MFSVLLPWRAIFPVVESLLDISVLRIMTPCTRMVVPNYTIRSTLARDRYSHCYGIRGLASCETISIPFVYDSKVWGLGYFIFFFAL